MADTTEKPDAADKSQASEALVTPPPGGGSANGPDGTDTVEPAPKKRSGVVRGLMVAAVIVIVGQGIILVSSGGLSKFLAPNEDPSRDQARIAALEEKLEGLEAADAEAAEKARNLANDIQTRGSEISALSSSVSELSQGGGLEGAEGVAADLQTAQSMIAALEERLDTFEAQTGEVDPLALPAAGGDTNPGQQAQASADVSEIKGALASLSERFASMNESLAATDGRIEALEETAPPENLDEILEGLNPQGEIEGLTARLAAIEEADPEGAARAAVLALSATELARAAATSRPFTTELEAFLALAPQNTFASTLRPYATEGAAMPKTLLLEFDAAADAIAEAQRIRAGGGLWNWVINQLTSLFSIRKVGELDGDDWQAVLARAENRIAIEDLAAAVTEVSALQGPAATGAAPWLARAEARASVDALVTQLTTEIFADLITALEGE